jgi:ankyrin repeat protein
MGDYNNTQYVYNEENQPQNNENASTLISKGNLNTLAANPDILPFGPKERKELIEEVIDTLTSASLNQSVRSKQLQILKFLLINDLPAESYKSPNRWPLQSITRHAPAVAIPLLRLVFEEWKTKEGAATFEKYREPLVSSFLSAVEKDGYQDISNLLLQEFPQLLESVPMSSLAILDPKIAIPMLKQIIFKENSSKPGRNEAKILANLRASQSPLKKQIEDALFASLTSSRYLDTTKFLFGLQMFDIDKASPLAFDKGNALHYAIRNNNVDAVKFLLSSNVKINYVNLIGDNLLITALKSEDPAARAQMVKAFLSRGDLKQDFQNSSGKTALMIAIEMGDAAIFKLLMNDSRFVATVPMRSTKSGKTVIDLAAEKSSLTPLKHDLSKEAIYDAILKELLTFSSTSKISTFNDLDSSLLAQAIKTNNKQFVDLILSRGIEDKDAAFLTGLTPLTLAIKEKNMEIVDLLLEKDSKLDKKNERGVSPLAEAFLTNDTSIIQHIMEAFQTYVKREPTPEEYGDILFGFASQETNIDYKDIFKLLNDLEIDTNPKQDGKTLLMVASQAGNERFVKFLLKGGADPNEFVDKLFNEETVQVTAYDLAKDMSMRLLIAPYLEKDQPPFRGFVKNDFNFISLFIDPVNNFLCPYCFATLKHGTGCMYVSVHNCERDKALLNSPFFQYIIHTKLFKTYYERFNDAISLCHHCNRACTTTSAGVVGGVQLLGHKHYRLRSANPFVLPQQQPATPGADPFDQTGCASHGGGSHLEKFIRVQTLVSFMCFLNTHFVEQISNHMAHLLCREVFIDAPLQDYIRTVPFSKSIPDTKIGGFATVKDLIQKVRADQTFIHTCEPPESLAPLEGAVAAEEVVVANVPRYGTNEVDLAPVEVINNVDGKVCFIKTAIELDENHPDDRILYGFKHRQPLTLTVYDHAAADQYVCAECLTSFINRTFGVEGNFTCFGEPDCQGHFHPTELQGKIPDELYQRYKAMYNIRPPRMVQGGGSEVINEKDYPALLGPVIEVNGNCPPPKEGGRKRQRQRRTRKIKKMKKTRKQRRYGKTRR